MDHEQTIKPNIHINERNTKGETAICIGVNSGSIAMIARLLNKDPCLLIPTNEGKFPFELIPNVSDRSQLIKLVINETLSQACTAGWVELVKYILQTAPKGIIKLPQRNYSPSARAAFKQAKELFGAAFSERMSKA